MINHLYVGAITFFFEALVQGIKKFLVLIDVAEVHDVVEYDRFMAKIALRRPGQHKYVICRFEDIVCSVGLVRYCQAERNYKVISHHIFKEPLTSKIGNSRNL